MAASPQENQPALLIPVASLPAGCHLPWCRGDGRGGDLRLARAGWSSSLERPSGVVRDRRCHVVSIGVRAGEVRPALPVVPGAWSCTCCTASACAVLIIVAATVMTIAGPQVVDRIQSWIVALTFFAFLGFAVISFAAGDLSNPKRQLPRAMCWALGVTTLLYVLVARCVFGALPVAEVVRFGPTAIAEAARPTLGDTGFTLMAVAALLATALSVTATLHASAGLTKGLADARLFPQAFGENAR